MLQEALAQFTGSVSASAWVELGISFMMSTWQHCKVMGIYGSKDEESVEVLRSVDLALR